MSGADLCIKFSKNPLSIKYIIGLKPVRFCEYNYPPGGGGVGRGIYWIKAISAFFTGLRFTSWSAPQAKRQTILMSRERFLSQNRSKNAQFFSPAAGQCENHL